MITAFIGPPGSGKTIAMTYSALRFLEKDYKIYSNYNIFHPETDEPLSKRIITTNDLNRARSGRLEIDELPAWLDSRFSMSDQNAFVSSVLQKNRKRDLSLEWSAQDFWMADTRIRVNTDYVVLPHTYYVINGRELLIKQDYFDPINLKLLLPFAYIRARMVSGWKYQTEKEKYLTEKDIIETFKFKAQPIAECYDTSEEVKDLITSELKKGIEREKDALEILKTRYSTGSWILNPDSGIKMNSFDIEGYIDGMLYIIDVTTLMKKKNSSYLNFAGKDVQKYKAVETSRQCKTFFMFMFMGDWYILPSFHVWDCAKTTMPLRKVLQFCKKVS